MKGKQDLLEERSTLVDDMRALLDKVETEGRDLTEAEGKKYDAMEKSLDGIEAEIRKIETREPVRSIEDRRRDAEPRSYRSMERALYGQQRKGSPYDKGNVEKDFQTFLQDIGNPKRTEMLDEHHREMRAFGEDSGPTGGYVVPYQSAAWLWDSALEMEIVRPKARIIPMRSDGLQIGGWDSSDHTAGLYGGWTVQHLAEGKSSTSQTGKLRSLTLTAWKALLRTTVSREQLDDGTRFREELMAGLRKALAFTQDEDYLTGNGVGKPMGAINTPATIKVDRQTASQFSWTDAVNMWSRLHPAFRNNAVWVMNNDIVPQLFTNFKDDNNNMLWVPGNMGGVSGDPPNNLLGRPIFYTEKLPALGTEGDVLLADFSQYVCGIRLDLVVEYTNAVNWATDQWDFRVVARYDGHSMWDKPITPKKGSNTLSWAVALR